MTTGRKDDAGKLRWGLLRKSLVLPLEAVIRVLMYGANKYGDDNWQRVDNPLVRYRDALDRHLADIDKGVIVDPDTGENNYAHVATNALFLLWFYLTGNQAVQAPRACTCHPDDRPDGPCRERYATSECQAQAANADAPLDSLRRIARAARASLSKEGSNG